MPAPGAGRSALVTGITGQDGSFLAELLLERGYVVTGLIRPGAGLGSSAHLRERLELIDADLLDSRSLTVAVAGVQPDELFHLAAPSFVPATWDAPAETVGAIAGATATLLEAVRDHSRDTRVFVATSSTIFGDTDETPQSETSRCRPRSPYAIAKLAGHQLAGALRERLGLFVCSGILYNHESERRPEQFVTRKITRAAAAIKLGLADELVLGDLGAIRDWSFAGDVMRGAWEMLQQDSPNDYILASGVPHTVGELAQIAFAHLGLDAPAHIRVDPDLVRPAEPVALIGDAARARERLGWTPTLSFEQLVHRMVDHDLSALQRTPSPAS